MLFAFAFVVWQLSLSISAASLGRLPPSPQPSCRILFHFVGHSSILPSLPPPPETSSSCDNRCQHERLVTNIPRLLLLLLSPHTNVVVVAVLVAYVVAGTDADAGAGAEAAAY